MNTIYRNSNTEKLRAIGEFLASEGHISFLTISEQWHEVPYLTTTASNKDILRVWRLV